ncbi:hypothetical protein [Bradyrhizobium sp. JR3.5]
MKSILTALAETGEVLLLKSDPEISPEKAAEILGISRPLVYRRMDSGELPFPVGRNALSDSRQRRHHPEAARASPARLRAGAWF